MSGSFVVKKCQCFKHLPELGVEDEPLPSGSGPDLRRPVFNPPDLLFINDVVQEYPNASVISDLPYAYEAMSKIVKPTDDYKENMITFWVLDMFLEALDTAQEAGMTQLNQNKVLHWVAHTFNLMASKKKTREQLFEKLREEILMPPCPASEIWGEDLVLNIEVDGEACSTPLWEIPYPPPIECEFLGGEGESETYVRSTAPIWEPTATTMDEEKSGECYGECPLPLTCSQQGRGRATNIRNMKTLLAILYRIFGHPVAYDAINAIYYSMPKVTTVLLPFKAWKPRLAPPPPAPPPPKGGKNPLPEPPALSSEDAEKEKQLHKFDYILPLQDADNAESFADKLFVEEITE